MQKLKFELIRSIIEHGSKFSDNETVDPSTSEELAEAGVALVTTYIEQLSLMELVRDPSPLFGSTGGRWIGYRLSDLGRQLSHSEGDLRRAVGELIGGPKTEVSEAVQSLKENCNKAKINESYKEDFLRTLDEIRICFDEECFIAAIALCGKLLEVCLKEMLIRNNVSFDPNAMIGSLIKAIQKSIPEEYTDPTLKNIVNIINTSRITAVHSKEKIPIPSRDQAIMVIFATRDVVLRNFSHVEMSKSNK
jgi:hypothetical protein